MQGLWGGDARLQERWETLSPPLTEALASPGSQSRGCSAGARGTYWPVGACRPGPPPWSPRLWGPPPCVGRAPDLCSEAETGWRGSRRPDSWRWC